MAYYYSVEIIRDIFIKLKNYYTIETVFKVICWHNFNPTILIFCFESSEHMNPSLNYNDDFLKDDNDTFSLAAHIVDQHKLSIIDMILMHHIITFLP